MPDRGAPITMIDVGHQLAVTPRALTERDVDQAFGLARRVTHDRDVLDVGLSLAKVLDQCALAGAADRSHDDPRRLLVEPVHRP